MQFDIHTRRAVKQRLSDISSRMASWELSQTQSADFYPRLVEAIEPFAHTTKYHELSVGGVDGTGDFPVLAYGDSFVYATVAAGTLYQADALHGLREVDTGMMPLVEFTWLAGSQQQRTASLLDSFERLSGYSIDDVIVGSDYRELSRRAPMDVASERAGLIVPPAHDAGNIGVQLRTTAELAMALRLIDQAPTGTLVLTDGTMALPFVQRKGESLFFEHLRRFCCVRARQRGIVFGALSKSHGLSSGIRLDDAANEKLGTPSAEHWFWRVPEKHVDEWSPVPADGTRIPPVGATTYIVRLHRNAPLMRLDIDAHYWQTNLKSTVEERRLFETLDYAAHDQRCFGYPYPIKAARDRASLSQQERVVLKKQVVEAAVGAGLKRSLLRDSSYATGNA